MSSTPWLPEKQAEVEDLARAIREAIDAEISELAADLATRHTVARKASGKPSGAGATPATARLSHQLT